MQSSFTKPFTQEDYEIVEREVRYQGFFRMVRYHLRYKLFRGGVSPVLTRELMERSSAAAVLPYDPILDQVVLIEQFRPGALANPESPWLIEIIAGTLEPDENPADLAIREGAEEGGCKILELLPITEYFVSPGGCNEYINIYCGRIQAGGIGGIHGLEEEYEDIRTFVVPTEEAFAMVRENKIKTSPAIVALQWLELNRNTLRKQWVR